MKRGMLRDWLACSTALAAYVRLVLGVVLAFIVVRNSAKPGLAWGLILLGLFCLAALWIVGAIGYLLLPPLFFFAGWLMIRLGNAPADFPCPVCGYDVRETPHHCPECGTPLRWGQLVK